jgi:hypothetical protein
MSPLLNNLIIVNISKVMISIAVVSLSEVQNLLEVNSTISLSWGRSH